MLAATSETGWLSGRLERPWGVAEAGPPAPRRPRLLDVVREALRVRHYSRRTERAYVGWIRRYVLFHGKRHPAEMGAQEVSRFLSWLARGLKWRPMMEEQNVRMAIDRHWAASAAGDQGAEHEIYHDDAVCEYPQSGEVIHGRRNLQALRSHHPGRPSGFEVRRIAGEGNFWVTEYVITYEGKRAYTVSIMEFRDGKVSHETQYFADPFDAPAWRAQWVERGA